MEPQTAQPKKTRLPLVIIAVVAGLFVVFCLCLSILGALAPDKDKSSSSTPIAQRAEQLPAAANEPEPTAPPTPTPTLAPTPSPEPTVFPTASGPVTVELNEEVSTEKWAVKITGAERTDTLEWQGRKLEPVGQWLILWADVRNLTTDPTVLFSSDFKLTTPQLKGEIEQDDSATRAATALRYDPSDTVADFFGMTVEAGSSRPMAVAFDVPPAAEELVLHINRDAGIVNLGRVDTIAALPVPTATPMPAPTDTPAAAPTPAPTSVPKATSTPEASSPTPQKPAAGPVANKAANLRAGPGTNYGQVGNVRAGQALDLVAVNQAGDWYKLATGDWIAAFLVDNAPDGLPVAEPPTPLAPLPATATPASGAPAQPTNPPPAASPARPVRAGTHIVGDTVQPGIYRGMAGQDILSSCYWARLSNLTGNMDSTIANDNAIGQFYVEVKPTDYALETACQLVPLAQAPVQPVGDQLPAGTYLVGRDIRPGTYKGEAGADILESCYWARLSDVAGGMEGVLANDNANGSYFVQVLPSDFALITACPLVRVGD